MFIVGALHELVLLAMNLYVIAKLLMIRRQMNKSYQSTDDKRDTEAKLFVLTLISFVFSSINFVQLVRCKLDHRVKVERFQAAFYASNNALPGWLLDLLFSLTSFGVDVHVLSQPLFLLLMSTAVREELRKVLKCAGTAESDRVFSTTSTTKSVRVAPL